MLTRDGQNLEQLQEDVELDQIKSFVRSSSKGLAEVTRNKASEVQFIHESVRDFLLGNHEGLWSGVSGNFIGHSHEILRNCCLAQLNASISKDVDIPDPLPQASTPAQLRETIRLKFPFLEYSVLNVLCHANSAQHNSIEQGAFLADFPLERWIFLNNALERFDVRRYTESVSLLYILAEKNLDHLIRIHPQREFCFDVENERYGLPIFAALATGSREAAQAFLEVQVKIQPQESPLHYLYKQYSENKNKLSKFDRNFTFSPRKSVLSQVVEQGDEVILNFLCASRKFDIELKDRSGKTPLLWTAANGHEAVVRLLLERGANPETKDNTGGTPLWWAARRGDEAIVKLLLEWGANTEVKDNNSWTPLWCAAHSRHLAVVKLLLEQGADTEAKDSNSWTPLSLVTMNGYAAIVKLLLEWGADTEAKDIYNLTPLLSATGRGYEAVVKLLLEHGANIKVKDSDSRTLLWWAACRGDEAIIKLLLEWGANTEIKDNSSRTPLWWAAQRADEAIVKLLLEWGANIEVKDSYSWTPLWWAAKNGHEAIVKLLMERGADIEVKDSDGRTPLWWAGENGHEAVVKLLRGVLPSN